MYESQISLIYTMYGISLHRLETDGGWTTAQSVGVWDGTWNV